MARERLLLFAFLVVFFPQTCYGRDNSHCAPSSCGNISNITYPFRLETDPSNCGDRRYGLSCENNVTVLYLNKGRYYVQAINYNNFTIRLVDAGLDQLDYFSIPQFPLYGSELEDVYEMQPYSNFKYKWADSEKYPCRLSQPIFFIECLNQVFRPLSYADSSASYCIKSGANDSSGSHLKMQYFSCLNIDELRVSALMDSCSIETVSLFPAAKDFNIKKKDISFIDIHQRLAFGFEISWFNVNCIHKCGIRSCYLHSKIHTQCFDDYNLEFLDILFEFLLSMQLGSMFLAARCLCGTPFVTAFLIYKWRRRHLSGYNTIEEFLQSHNNLMPIRYAYSDIKKMTGGFKEKLGEGGFGCVYKAKLRSGQFAAIKMLGKSKANGQDFINEVATIGRIHHANVVKLIGFCVEGTKRALVYEFLSNGSLDNYIFSRQGYVSLCWEKLYQISQGVARGIQYLHRGCEMQILHFDIKPHNILLDENFTPKISDFGLAKLYPTKGSIANCIQQKVAFAFSYSQLEEQ
ncbi:rust resistance kinase Lr10 [Jatropha curcas]|uniref:rust resistance kinase Lr10 n=1 Tax=Jatropha curcas TaxID=180498 RepID=UPI0018945D06|nr:rust resistance kinase Lr10 [Jatropha curcas]